jgi:hypothetical protein
MNTFPSNKLPRPATNFSGDNDSSTIRTKMDSGKTRQQRRFTKDVRTVKAQWSLTDTEFTLFQAFVYYKTSSGADWFNIDLPSAGGIKSFVARFKDGKYTFSHAPILNWKVTATLELQSEQLMTEAAYNAAIA